MQVLCQQTNRPVNVVKHAEFENGLALVNTKHAATAWFSYRIRNMWMRTVHTPLCLKQLSQYLREAPCALVWLELYVQKYVLLYVED